MASQTAILAQLGPGWRYDRKTRGYLSDTGERLSRRQADKRYGLLKQQGYGSYEEKAAARQAKGIAPGPGRGHKGQLLHREFSAPVYDTSAPDGWRMARLDLNKRDASLVGTLWAEYDGGSMLHSSNEFKRKYDHRVVHDKVTHARYELVGDMDLLNRWYDALTDEERDELWEMLYERRWSHAA